MNKRFFTLMAAVMLAGSPFAANYAFAQSDSEEEVIIEESSVRFLAYDAEDNVGAKLANGVKFIVKSSDQSYVTVVSKKVKNGTFMEIAAPETPVTDPEKAAKFEIRNFTKNALGVTFTLYVDGKQFAYGGGDNADASLTFTAAGEKLGNVNAINIAKIGGDNTDIFGQADGAKLGTIMKTYDAAAFAEYNKNSVTLGFDGTNVEGNAFVGVQAFTFGEGALLTIEDDPETANVDETEKSAAGTYFVKGDAKYIKALKDAATPAKRAEALAKLSVVYVQNARYDINALTVGEGYKIVTISGADFYKETGAAHFENAAFTYIVEDDQLNDEGSLVMEISPIVGANGGSQIENLQVVAIKPSATDTKTYVTTINPDPTLDHPSTFTPIYPTLGGNTYFAASDFLKKGAPSAYNVYFVSGDPSTATTKTEYHKYLVVTNVVEDDDNDEVYFTYGAYAKSDLDTNTPYAQWIATGFDNKYTLTLTNRATGASLPLKLQTTDVAGVYDVHLDGLYVNDGVTTGVEFSDTQIKLIPTTLGKYDGFLNLSEDEMKAGIKLAFSGKDALLGTPTYYAQYDKDPQTTAGVVVGYNVSLIPNVNPAKADVLNVNAFEPEDDATEDEDFMLTTPYAYLDESGKIGVAEKADTLIVPAYQFTTFYSINSVRTDLYATDELTYSDDEDDAEAFVFAKALNGKYVLVPVGADGAIGVKAKEYGGTRFFNSANPTLPDAKAFAYVDVIVNDDSDKTTLEAVSRHATLESTLGAVAFRTNSNGILEGILAAEPMTFWLDTADTDAKTPSFYISKGIAVDTTAATKAYDGGVRNFLYMPADSAKKFDENSAVQSKDDNYILEGTTANYKAIFRPANLVAEDTLTTVVDGKEVKVTGDDVKEFKYRISLVEEGADEYTVKSLANGQYLYSLNGKLGFTDDPKQAMAFTLGAGDPTANEAIEAESSIEVIGGQGVVTVQGAAGKVVTVANILGQTLANQVAASDNVTIAVPAGIVVVAVDGEATKVIVK